MKQNSKSLPATQEDLSRTEAAIRAGVRIEIDERTKEPEERINLLPTKNEFFGWMDKLMKELEMIREENTVSGYQLKDHGERLTLLEQKTGITYLFKKFGLIKEKCW